jgi:two-component system cell cycle sensor histidine kinase/response regulator CckA
VAVGDGFPVGRPPPGRVTPADRATPWSRLGGWLIDPAVRVRSLDDASRMRLLALLVPLTLLIGFGELIFSAARAHYSFAWYLYAMAGLGYLLARLGLVRLGAVLFVYALPVTVFVRVALGMAFNPLVSLTALVIPPLLAAILLAQTGVMVLLVIEALMPVALVALVPSAFPDPAVVAAPTLLTIFVGGLVLAFMRHRDLLEQVRQQELHAREQHFRALVANIPGVVYRATCDGDRRLLYLSDGILELSGWGTEEFLGSGRRTLHGLVHPDDLARVRLEQQRSLEQAHPYALEYRILGADQGVRWVLDRGRVVSGEQGPALSVDGVLIDITRRQAAVAERERLAAIVEATSDLVSTALPDGSLQYLNPAGRRLLGWHMGEDVASRGIGEAHPRWAREIVERQGIPIAVEFGVWAGETALLHGDGHETPVSQVIMAHRSATGKLEFLSTIMRDLSERAGADAALKESEERFRLLAVAAFEGIVITDEGRVVDANEQLAELLRMERAQLIGRHVMDFVAPESRELVLEHLRQRSEAPYEHLALRPDGSVFPVEIRARTIPFGGRLQRVTALRDLTERKRLEEERVLLERRVQHGQKLESLGVLAGGIAHDFNNLLVAVLGNLDLATLGLAPDAPQRRHLAQAEHAAQHGAALARELLAYSGRGRFVVRPVDLSALVEEMGQLLRTAVPKNIRLEMQLERSMLPVMADAAQLQQVIMNLIVNAAEANAERSGVITLTTSVAECGTELLERSRLAVKPPPGRFVSLEVADDGCGMTPVVQERLFDPFFSTKRAGRGLGMAAVQGILQGHGGAILLESTPGRGTRFRVLLPVAAPADAAAAAEPAPSEPRVPGRTRLGGLVLVADDEAAVRATSQAMLERLGFSVVTAVDGQEAVELFRRVGEQVAFVLLDLTMPNMDGLEALAELRRLRPGLRVLLASGFDQTEISARCDVEHPDGFLQKPYRLETLLEAVEAVLLG